jgi:hypothetical protein
MAEEERSSTRKRSEQQPEPELPGAAPLPRAHAVPLVGDLKRALEQNEATWSVNALLSEGDELPTFPLGGVPEDLVPASETPPVDFGEIAQELPTNPFIIERRLELGLVHPDLEHIARSMAPHASDDADQPKGKRARKTTAKQTKPDRRSGKP